MKRYVGCLVLLVNIFLLSGCQPIVKEVRLSDLDWKMEFISDKNGNMLVSGNSKDNLADVYKNINCICDEKSNITIGDETEGKSWSGHYYLKLKDKDTMSYELTFPNNIEATGILGKRKYEGGKGIYSFIIYTDDKIISFLSYSK